MATELVDHPAAVRREVRPVLAAFDGPARAIRCGSMIAEVARRFGCPIQLGAHTGECELLGDTIRGLTVDTAVQVATRAAPGDVIVSGTVRDLVAGSGLKFRDCGLHIRPGDETELSLLGVEAAEFGGRLRYEFHAGHEEPRR